MGRRDRERRERLINGSERMKESGLPRADERYRDLAKMRGCATADEAQLFMYLSMGKEWGPIECPHCEEVQSIEELLKDRPPCEEIGHPEQLQAVMAGGTTIPCVLCGETPEYDPAV